MQKTLRIVETTCRRRLCRTARKVEMGTVFMIILPRLIPEKYHTEKQDSLKKRRTARGPFIELGKNARKLTWKNVNDGRYSSGDSFEAYVECSWECKAKGSELRWVKDQLEYSCKRWAVELGIWKTDVHKILFCSIQLVGHLLRRCCVHRKGSKNQWK